jgi:DNA invertase Pin-like site-specific DNA recombinase
MNVGYVRLSKDDDKRNYVSIENQKLIIEQHAATLNMIIERWYEDDGVSGYKFDRPAFSQLRKDLKKDIDVLFTKDFSRIGRHNAKVLLFLDTFQEGSNRLIVIDDNYDSENPDDDTVGIKTWYNERYVRDTSKKIRRVLSARQQEGTLLTHVPFGYIRNKQNKEQIEIVPNEAEQVSAIFQYYIQGMGYRKIAVLLNANNIPTPSMLRHERELAEGKISKRHIASLWSDSIIRELLDNDFYIGNYRLHKRSRNTIHGTDKRVPKEKQHLFENHHIAIIDKPTFELVQEIKEKRNRHNYRGSHGKWTNSTIPNPFGSCLFCKDCGSKLTPIVRNTSARTRKYYICSTYNSKGRAYCSKAHLIEENDLMKDVTLYVRLCRNSLSEVISTYDLKDFESEQKSIKKKRGDIDEQIKEQKMQLKTLFTQKIKDTAQNPEHSELIAETYNMLQNDILAHIHGLEMQLMELSEIKLETPDVKEKLKTALEVVDNMIQNDALDRRDIEILIERIIVDENGQPDIELKFGLSNFVPYNPGAELNKYENEIILTTMNLIYAESRNYTSAKYLAARLTEAGYKKSNKSVLPYIGLMIEKGFLSPTSNPLKPYSITIEKEELLKYIQDLHDTVSIRRYATNGI